jgi:hypothetical protein
MSDWPIFLAASSSQSSGASERGGGSTPAPLRSPTSKNHQWCSGAWRTDLMLSRVASSARASLSKSSDGSGHASRRSNHARLLLTPFGTWRFIRD